MVSAARNTKHSTERCDWKVVAFTMDEYESHGLLLAKNSVAFSRISKSMSTRLCSRRKRMNSSRSSDVSAPVPPFPASILARCLSLSVRGSSGCSYSFLVSLYCWNPSSEAIMGGTGSFVSCRRYGGTRLDVRRGNSRLCRPLLCRRSVIARPVIRAVLRSFHLLLDTR